MGLKQLKKSYKLPKITNYKIRRKSVPSKEGNTEIEEIKDKIVQEEKLKAIDKRRRDMFKLFR